MKNSPTNDDMVISRQTNQQPLATANNAPALPPIHLCRLGDYASCEYLTGFEGDRVVIRECYEVKKCDFGWRFAWEQGRTICSEAKERAQDVFALCDLLNRFRAEIHFFNAGPKGNNEIVNKVLSMLVTEYRCSPSKCLIQIEPSPQSYEDKEYEEYCNRMATYDDHLPYGDLFITYARKAANYEAK